MTPNTTESSSAENDQPDLVYVMLRIKKAMNCLRLGAVPNAEDSLIYAWDELANDNQEIVEAYDADRRDWPEGHSEYLVGFSTPVMKRATLPALEDSDKIDVLDNIGRVTLLVEADLEAADELWLSSGVVNVEPNKRDVVAFAGPGPKESLGTNSTVEELFDV